MTETTAHVIRHVKSALSQYHASTNAPIVVALSGGVDSQVLAHSLMSVATETDHRLRALHVDHGLRDKSAEDARSVAALCREWGLPSDIVTVDVAPWDRLLRQGTEAAARAARYSALARAAQKLDATLIATGHTLDDQAETILLRLIAGSGLDGLGGISQLSTRHIRLDPDDAVTRAITLLRPLLNCSRSLIERYAREHELTPIEDDSNELTSYRRNAIRLNVFPELEAIEPAFRQSISRTTQLLQEDARFINESVDRLYDDIVVVRDGVWMIDRMQFCEAHVAQQRRILYRVVELLTSPSARIGQERIDALRDATVNGRTGTTIELADDLLGYIDYDRLALGHADTLEADLRRLCWLPLIEPGAKVPLSGEIEISLVNGWRVCGEAPVDSGLVLRTRRDGDRVRDKRGRRTKLQDWLVDRKVPRYVRDWLPLVADGGEIRWIIGLDTTEYDDARNGVHLHLELDSGMDQTNG